MGAWIETSASIGSAPEMQVAPLVGAWIETEWQRQDIKYNASHPSWVRGLKHKNPLGRVAVGLVAPLVGAWIETTSG